MVNMDGSMKIFQYYQKSLHFIGIYPSQPNEKQSPINLKNKILLIACLQTVLTTAAFIIFDATSMFDFGMAFFALISISECEFSVLILIWQSDNTFQFFTTCEKFIEKSKNSILV